MRRIGKLPVVEFGDLALLIHLMSAGRLRHYDKRASLKDRASRVLIRLEDGRELRLREYGTKQRAWAKLLPAECRRRGRGGRPAGAGSLAGAAARALRRADRPAPSPAPAAPPPGRHRRDRPLLGRRDPLGGAPLPFKKGSDLDGEEVERLLAALHVLGDAIDHYEETIPEGEQLPDKAPKPLRIHKHEGEPCPRCGTTIEAVFFAEHQMNYCPKEQTGGGCSKIGGCRNC